MTSLTERIQKACLPAAGLFLLLWLCTAAGCQPLPEGDPGWAWWLLLPLLVAGVAGGLATARRSLEIDRQRWEIVEDPLLTSGEREWAHKEAERQIRWAGTVFLLAPLTLGVWLADHFSGDSTPFSAILLALSPLLGFFLGLLSGRRSRP
jgi:hypothetical protein